MKFTKMHGCGNDYVYVDCTKEVIPNISETAIRVSDRHFGIGSDGLILIKASDVADFEMDMYNADGSRGKMCGNGIRCVAKYVYDHGLTDKTTITVNTLSGIKTLKLTVEDGKVSKVRVDMGEPELIPAQVPVKASVLGLADDRREAIVAEPLEIKGRSYDITCVSMGNPHCITFIGEDVRDFPLEAAAPVFCKISWTPTEQDSSAKPKRTPSPPPSVPNTGIGATRFAKPSTMTDCPTTDVPIRNTGK